jgi:hypothetical protein
MLKTVLQRWRHVLLLAAAGFFLILPAIIKGIPRGGDLNHHYRTSVSLYESVRRGDFHPGWNSLSTDGYGDVSFRFYPPAFYAFMVLARMVSRDWYSATLLVFIFLSILGGFGVYYWARIFIRPKLALAAGLLFMVNPYHVNELYQSSMLPEYAACALLPFAFAFVELLCQSHRARYVILLGASYAMLLLTHLPLTVIGSLSLAIYALFRIRKSQYVKSLVRLTLALLLGLAASAFYWVTMISELAWMRGNKVVPDLWYDYRYNFLFGKAVEGSTTWWAAVLAFGTLLTAMPAVVLLKKAANVAGNKTSMAIHPSENRSSQLPADDNAALQSPSPEAVNHSTPFTALSVLTIVSFLMMVPLSRPVWDVVPFLKEVQFPWRWLTVASMACSILCAASLPHLFEMAKSKRRPLVLLAAGCVLMAISLTMFQVIRGATFVPRSNFDSFLQTIAASQSLRDWLPVWASEQTKEMKGEIDAQDRGVSITSWQAEQRSFQITAGQASEARVRTYYYPHWMATADGKPLATRADADGALIIALPKEAVTVDLTFREPQRVWISNAISLLAWAFCAASALLFLYKRRSQPGDAERIEPELVVNRVS